MSDSAAPTKRSDPAGCLIPLGLFLGLGLLAWLAHSGLAAFAGKGILPKRDSTGWFLVHFALVAAVPSLSFWIWLYLIEPARDRSRWRKVQAKVDAGAPDALEAALDAMDAAIAQRISVAPQAVLPVLDRALAGKAPEELAALRVALSVSADVDSHGAGAFNADGWLALDQMQKRTAAGDAAKKVRAAVGLTPGGPAPKASQLPQA